MRRAVATLSIVLPFSTMLAQSAPIDKLAWMSGCWEQRAPGRVVMEMWMPPAGGMMMGASRTFTGDPVRTFEQIRIVARGDTLVYVATPSGQTLTEFKSTAIGDGTVRFENPTHDFPRVITYDRVGADSVIARIAGPGANNTTRTAQYPMRRVSCTERPAPPPPPDTSMFDVDLSPDGRRAAFVKGVGSNFDIHVGALDGSSAKAITNFSGVDYQPSWSPDGTRILFSSSRAGVQNIFSMRADGTDVVQLTQGAASNSEGSWSPDGKSIVFRSERDGGHPQLYVMNADGTNQRALTRDSTAVTVPTWSPDGKLIAFTSSQSGHGEIHVVNADGTGRKVLTETPQIGAVRHSSNAVWSPDGKLIAFFSTRDGGNQEVYVMNADGTNVRNVSNHAANDYATAWTRDGRIVFRSSRDRALFDFYTIMPDGTGLTRITTSR